MKYADYWHKKCYNSCMSKSSKGVSRNVLSDHPNWNGGRRKRGRYVYIRILAHPFADCMGYVAEHRIKMEKKLGRFLKHNEVVHHKNENTLDNRVSNLHLMTKGEHAVLHNIQLKKVEKMHKAWRKKAKLYGTNTLLWNK